MYRNICTCLQNHTVFDDHQVAQKKYQVRGNTSQTLDLSVAEAVNDPHWRGAQSEFQLSPLVEGTALGQLVGSFSFRGQKGTGASGMWWSLICTSMSCLASFDFWYLIILDQWLMANLDTFWFWFSLDSVDSCGSQQVFVHLQKPHHGIQQQLGRKLQLNCYQSPKKHRPVRTNLEPWDIYDYIFLPLSDAATRQPEVAPYLLLNEIYCTLRYSIRLYSIIMFAYILYIYVYIYICIYISICKS